MIRFSEEKVLLLHQLMIAETGGSVELRDIGLLDSALEGIFQTFGGVELYPESVIYEDADLTAPLFTLKEDGGVLLITEETETAFKVWWITYADEPLSGYIAKSDIADISFSEEARQTLKEQRPCGFIASDIGYRACTG